MKRYIAFFKSVIRHKYYVYKIGRKMRLSRFQLLMHDLSKFFPSEFFNYALAFYNESGEADYAYHDGLDVSWCRHQKRNKHHWQYWVVLGDSGSIESLQIPEHYLREMAADMLAMDMAGSGDLTALDYFNKNRVNFKIDNNSKYYIETLIKTYGEHQ